MSAAVITQVQETMRELSEQKQEQVLRYARSLQHPLGFSGNEFMQFAGLFPSEDLAEINAAIEEGCEQVDSSEWSHNRSMVTGSERSFKTNIVAN